LTSVRQGNGTASFLRILVEIFIHGLKRFRAIATRYQKTARNDLALVHLSRAWLWLS